ncbi:hypothetical protein [Curtobacterium sp. ISL-83]|uniref:hypothetical protein n=1 Tax=Curtobacterium sp. ISL-83 TaxID=2819145 RepID=UPI001BE6652F|nr:hypothetical protein [Curtobacterium sp. ISL-83]MBT2504098.1 hypothetical protein [Curtobacterium sp. ISL-83]
MSVHEPGEQDEPGGQDGLARALALGVLHDAGLGDRLVVRAHDGGGARDALGDLIARTATAVTIHTRRGPVEVALVDVVAAKHVPAAPDASARLTPFGAGFDAPCGESTSHGERNLAPGRTLLAERGVGRPRRAAPGSSTPPP